MKKALYGVMLTALLFAVALPGFCFDPATPPAQRNAILFCWDGAQRDHVKECLAKGELPNLAALIKEGGMVNIDISGHATDTKAGHTQMLTGLDPDVTGVMSNSKFKAFPTGYSVFERLEKQYGDESIVTLALTGKGHHVGSCPPATAEQIADAKKQLAELPNANAAPKKKKNAAPRAKAGRKKAAGSEVTGVADPDAAMLANKKKSAARQRLSQILQNTEGEPFYNMSKAIDVWDGEKSRTYTQVGPLMLGYLDKHGKQRFCAFFHFSDPDHMGHNHGENSKEYNQALIDCDKQLGECVKKLRALGVYEKTMVFVNADHGFDEGQTSHKNAPYVYLAANTKLAKAGHQRDVVPTILNEMGVDVTKLEPKLKGSVLTK